MLVIEVDGADHKAVLAAAEIIDTLLAAAEIIETLRLSTQHLIRDHEILGHTDDAEQIRQADKHREQTANKLRSIAGQIEVSYD